MNAFHTSVYASQSWWKFEQLATILGFAIGPCCRAYFHCGDGFKNDLEFVLFSSPLQGLGVGRGQKVIDYGPLAGCTLLEL